MTPRALRLLRMRLDAACTAAGQRGLKVGEDCCPMGAMFELELNRRGRFPHPLAAHRLLGLPLDVAKGFMLGFDGASRETLGIGDLDAHALGQEFRGLFRSAC